MKVPSFHLAKNLTMYGFNFKVTHRFTSLSDCTMFCNRIGIRLNYTNAACLVKYSQLGHKPRVSDRPNERKSKFKFRDTFDTLSIDGILTMPLLVKCNKNQTRSLDFEALFPKNNENISKTEYIKQVLPSLHNIKVQMLCEVDAVQRKFNSNSVFSNSCTLMDPLILPYSVNSSNVYNFNYSNNVNEINYRVQSSNSSNISLEYVMCSPASQDEKVPSPRQEPQKDLGKPSEETLLKISNNLSEQMQSFFVKPLNYRMYTIDLIFENRIKEKVTVGLFPYIRQLSFIRLIGHVKYAYVQMEILKVTQHPEDGTVRVRWRIVGVSALKSLPFLFTLKSYSMQAVKEKLDTWYDGFSTFYVNKDGLIYKHVADKMMPDEGPLIDKKPSFIARLTALLGRTMKAPSAAVSTSVVDEPKGKNSSQLSRDVVKKSSLALPFIGKEFFESCN